MMRAFAAMVFALAMSLTAGAAFAVQPDEILADKTLEARARTISAGLRCLVCQNQSIDDSDASLARDLRLLVRERLTKGDTDEQVIDFVVARYGEFVLLRPPVSPATILLWIAPILLVVGGGAYIWRVSRRRNSVRDSGAQLTSEETARLKELLDS